MMGHNSQTIASLRKSLKKVADKKVGESASAYMRHQFDFLGVKTPIRREITQTLISESKLLSEKQLISLCRDLWKEPEREFQYVACDLLINNSKRLSKDFVIKDAKWFITTKSWWDSVDSVRTAIEVVIDQNPELRKVTDIWVKSDNIWLVRVAIIHQLKLGTRTDVKRLEKYCTVRANDKEFFIAKAIGWALRSYSYTDPKWVLKFIKQHPELQPLSIREAKKSINRQKTKVSRKLSERNS